jgi:hypothetical protein
MQGFPWPLHSNFHHRPVVHDMQENNASSKPGLGVPIREPIAVVHCGYTVNCPASKPGKHHAAQCPSRLYALSAWKFHLSRIAFSTHPTCGIDRAFAQTQPPSLILRIVAFSIGSALAMLLSWHCGLTAAPIAGLRCLSVTRVNQSPFVSGQLLDMTCLSTSHPPRRDVGICIAAVEHEVFCCNLTTTLQPDHPLRKTWSTRAYLVLFVLVNGFRVLATANLHRSGISNVSLVPRALVALDFEAQQDGM